MKKLFPLIAFSILLLAPMGTQQGFAGLSETVVLGPNGESPQIPIELVQMDLVSSSPIQVPLASDPSNALGDSIDGYGFVESDIRVSISPSTPSTGLIQLKIDPPGPQGSTIVSQGQDFQVDSFFDVFYDITLTDIDATDGITYAGESDGASITFPNNGPVRLSTNYLCSADVTQPLMGCLLQLRDKLLVGDVPLEIPLGIDVNGNGEVDKIKISGQQLAPGLVAAVGFMSPDGPYSVSFDSFFDITVAAVVDESADPPFMGVLDAGEPVIILVPAPGALPPLPPFPDGNGNEVIGGELIPIDSVALLAAGIQSSYSILTALVAVGSVAFGVLYTISKRK